MNMMPMILAANHDFVNAITANKVTAIKLSWLLCLGALEQERAQSV